MNTNQQSHLDRLVTTIQSRWGHNALYPAQPHTHDALSTGYTGLDDLLGIGGLPRSSMTAFHGAGTSGMTTLTYRIMSHAQSQRHAIAYFDLRSTFDGAYARLSGIDLSTLLIVRPSPPQALDILRDLIVTGDIDLIVLDSFGDHLKMPRKLHTTLSRSRCALLTLNADYMQDDNSFMRLQLTREKWLRQDGDVIGIRTQITLEKHRLMPAGGTIMLDIPFAEVTA